MSFFLIHFLFLFFFFFFQAEDGIRDHCVTRVQTCALPISFGGRSPRVKRAPRASPSVPKFRTFSNPAPPKFAWPACKPRCGWGSMRSVLSYCRFSPTNRRARIDRKSVV